ncbi:sulfurtransferase complex subunit TusC [Colwellia sp. UCD-KL20]|uniref:sulfurtransferase complex subunit TusC n=1 Tax=Colwellia sp. UCD-KL20 TaxID=1917165 RepID=UPI00097052E4|nr:sulfurtransferase complex subunit TusC [Colwellia sp. UCD-KL20]
MSESCKKIAILNASSTINQASKEALDAALIYGSYEQSTSLFFQGEGVRQLISHQQLETVHVKDYLKTMAALEFYDIDNIYVCKASMIERGLVEDFHVDNVQVLSSDDFSDKLHQHNVILRF